MHVLAQEDRLIERPGAVGIKRHAGAGKALCQRGDGLDLLLARQYAALQFEVGEAILIVRRLCQPDHGLGGHRFLMPQPKPACLLVFAGHIGQIGLSSIADEEQVTERFDAHPLHAFAEQRGDRQAEMLAQQVEQRRFHRGDGMNHDAEVEGLFAAAAGVAIGEGGAHRGEYVVAGANRLADDQIACILESCADLLAAGNFADADVARIVGEDHQVAGEERRMRAAQIEEHAVATGNRDHLHVGNDRRTRKSGTN